MKGSFIILLNSAGITKPRSINDDNIVANESLRLNFIFSYRACLTECLRFFFL